MNARYHINMQTGRVGKCRAVNKCPFGDLLREHYPTIDIAKKVYEKKMNEYLIRPPVRKDSLKDMAANDLAHALFMEADKTNLNVNELSDVLELSSMLHAQQKRMHRGYYKNTPYIEHPLRATLRLMRHGVKDEYILKAALLHDTVEDCGKVFVRYFSHDEKIDNEIEARKKLLDYISQNYGDETAKLVKAVTNDYVDEKASKQRTAIEKRTEYFNHLEKEITNSPKAMLIKLSDFVDNAGSLYKQLNFTNHEKIMGQALKYHPCIDIFERELSKGIAPIDESGLKYFKQHLSITRERLDKIIAN